VTNDRDGTERESRLVSEQAEKSLRSRVRELLIAEFEFEHPDTQKSEDLAHARMIRAERRRIIREEEDRFHDEKGLVRYRNHRGDIEWLTNEEVAQRKELQGRRSSGSSKGASRKSRGSWKGAVGCVTVVAVIVIALVLASRFGVVIRGVGSASYTVMVRSVPPGAAIFINGKPTGMVTDGRVTVRDIGTHVIEVIRPGYLTVPARITVDVIAEEAHPEAAFSLYHMVRDTTEKPAKK
jgi:hypothetical protein